MSRRFINFALESDKPAEDPKTVVMQGPLAEIYRKALDVAYAKKDSVTGEATVGQADGIATESQANDAMMLSHLRDMLGNHDQALSANEREEDGEPSAVLTIYGVSDAQVEDQDVVNVTQQLARCSGQDDFVLILDATSRNDGNTNTSGRERLVALEAMTQAHGRRVYRSLEQLASAMKR